MISHLSNTFTPANQATWESPICSLRPQTNAYPFSETYFFFSTSHYSKCPTVRTAVAHLLEYLTPSLT